jgi:fructose-bisphosphate aldolase, class I
MAGSQIRWNRFIHPSSGLGLLVPIDHGLTLGPVQGLQDLDAIGRWAGHRAITGLIAHKGMVARLGRKGLLPRGGLMVHLTGMTSMAPAPDRKELLTSVQSAMRIGADAVSLQINFDGQNDSHNLVLLGSVVDQALAYELPVLTMLYDTVPQQARDARVKRMRHLMRVAIELGTDALKLAAPASRDEMAALLDGVTAHTPVFFAGGSICSDEQLLSLAECVVTEHAGGLCVGRNVFQRSDPRALLDRLEIVLHGPQRSHESRSEERVVTFSR